ncbi:TPA: hypothetical protein MBF00_000587 [Klebsiella aerogenes]|nr:hypothetical protein [Klebsiella aerogenes]
MSIEVLGFLLALLLAIGSFIAWVINVVDQKHARNIELEKRISGLEQNLRLTESKNSSSDSDISSIKNILSGFEERTRNNEINIAILKNEKKRDS